MRVAKLTRVSKGEQAGDARHSLPEQDRAIRERCAREGWTIVAEFEAPGESASTRYLDRRPQLRSLVEAARRREFDVVVYHESSRLARDEELSQWLINELETVGVRLVESTFEADYFYTPEGRFHYGLTSGLDAWQRRKHGQQVAKGKRGRFEKGLHVGDLPFGYRMQLRTNPDGTVEVATELPCVPVEEEAAAIRAAFEMRAGGMGPTEIARRWNALGLRPHSKQGNGVFTESGVSSVLENDFYAGFVRHAGDRRRGVHEPLITEDLWARAQEARQSGRRQVRSRNPRALSGLAVCAECGGPLWLSWSGPSGAKYPYYRETSSIRQRACPNRSTGWRCEGPEEIVGNTLKGIAFDDEWFEHVDREARRVPRDDVYTAERADLEGRKRKARMLFVENDMPESEYRDLKRAIDARLSALPAAIPGGVLFVGERLREFGRVWDGMTDGEKRDACRAVLRTVVMDTRARRLWMDPKDEWAPLFHERRRWMLVMRPRQDRDALSEQSNPRPWLFLPRELVVA